MKLGWVAFFVTTCIINQCYCRRLEVEHEEGKNANDGKQFLSQISPVSRHVRFLNDKHITLRFSFFVLTPQVKMRQIGPFPSQRLRDALS